MKKCWLCLLLALLIAALSLPAVIAETDEEAVEVLELVTDSEEIEILAEDADEDIPGEVEILPEFIDIPDEYTEEVTATVEATYGEESNNESSNDEEPEEFEIINGVLVKYNGDGGDVVIPDGITAIGTKAFESCYGLTSVSIPNSVTSIGDYAFHGCWKLTHITIPDNVKYLGKWAFFSCYELTDIPIPNSVTSIEECTFAYCKSLTSISIPNSVTSIGGLAFQDCTNLSSIFLPDSVSNIEFNAFSDCTSLTNISIPEGVTIIGSKCFSGCSNITSISIPESVSSIGYSSFEGCTRLKNTTLPSNLKSLDSNTFKDCYSLTDVTFNNGNLSIDNSAFDGCPTSLVFHTPCETNATKWAESKGYTVDKSAHTPVTDPAVAPTCIESGMTAGSHCSVCGEILKAQETVAAKGHSWGSVTYTWAADNSTVTAKRICANDAGHVETETVVTVSSVALAPTCTAKGKTTYTSEFSNAAFATQSKTAEDIAATGHTAVDIPVVAAACTATGLTKGSKCSVCGEILKAQTTVAKLAHKAIDIPAVAATCTKTGLTKGSKCSVCGEILKAQTTVAKLAHKAVDIPAVAATCTATGLTKGSKCSVCGDILKAQETVPATGHTEVTDLAVAPTYTATGLTEGSHCSVCGAVLKAQETVPALALHIKKSTSTKVNLGDSFMIVVDGKKVKSYKSSDKKIASVSSKGIVKAKKAGTAKITITLKNGKKLTLTVKVTDPYAPKSIKITNGKKVPLKKGKKLTLKTTLTPDNAKTKLTWSSSNSKVAKVSNKGVVTAKKKGTAKITVKTANGKKATITITVK